MTRIQGWLVLAGICAILADLAPSHNERMAWFVVGIIALMIMLLDDRAWRRQR